MNNIFRTLLALAALLITACKTPSQSVRTEESLPLAPGFDCSLAVTTSEKAICADPGLRYLDQRLNTLYSEVRTQPRRELQVREEQLKWISERDACSDVECLRTAYLQRIEALDRLVRQRRICNRGGMPVVVYRTVWSSGINGNEPADELVQAGPELKSLVYYTEILGGGGRTITHEWYKNGVMQGKSPLESSSDRSGVWSSWPVDDRAAIWEVRAVEQSGCELKAEIAPLGRATEHVKRKSNENAHGSRGERFQYTWERIIRTRNDAEIPDLKAWAANSRNDKGDTPLLLAIRTGYTQAVWPLLTAGASPYVWDGEGKSALELAEQSQDPDIVAMVEDRLESTIPPWSITNGTMTDELTEGVPATGLFVLRQFDKPVSCWSRVVDGEGRTVTHDWFALESDGWKKKYSASMRPKTDIWDAVSTYQLPKENRMWRVDVRVDGRLVGECAVKAEIGAGSKESERWPLESTPESGAFMKMLDAWVPAEKIARVLGELPARKEWVSLAIGRGNMEYVRLFGSRGSILHTRMHGLTTPGLAVANRRRAVLTYLLAAGLDVNDAAFGTTALHKAAEADDTAALEILLEWGADIDAQPGPEENTPLMTAARNCSLAAARFLVRRGASLTAENHRGKTALFIYEFLTHSCPEPNVWTALLSKGVE